MDEQASFSGIMPRISRDGRQEAFMEALGRLGTTAGGGEDVTMRPWNLLNDTTALSMSCS
jgi:hypothetical protein